MQKSGLTLLQAAFPLTCLEHLYSGWLLLRGAEGTSGEVRAAALIPYRIKTDITIVS